MTNKVDGAALASCFKVVASCGKEIQALSDTLNNLITEAISSNRELPCVLNNERVNYQDCMDDSSGWVYTDIAYSFPLKRLGKGQQKTSAYLGYQISMMGDGIAAPGNDEPLIHVFLWAAPVDFDEYYMGYPIDKDAESRVLDERLIMWNSENPEKWPSHHWVFSLHLTSLNSSEDLERCVVKPALALLRGESVLSALPDSIEGLIRYTDSQLIYETGNEE